MRPKQNPSRSPFHNAPISLKPLFLTGLAISIITLVSLWPTTRKASAKASGTISVGRISGKLTQARTNNALAGVTVKLQSATVRGFTHTTATNATGDYTFSGLALDTYLVSVAYAPFCLPPAHSFTAILTSQAPTMIGNVSLAVACATLSGTASIDAVPCAGADVSGARPISRSPCPRSTSPC